VAESLDEARSGDVSPATLERAAAEMARMFDVRYGGFGAAPKFPHPAAVQFLLARWHDTREDWVREGVEKTLTGMARGGLPEQAFPVARRVFDVEERGEMHHNPRKNVLWWKSDPAGDDEWPLLERALGQLKAARDRRPAPFVDTTPYVNWNAMMASAFLHAGAMLDRPDCNALALKVLERIWSEAWDDGGGMGHVIDRAEP